MKWAKRLTLCFAGWCQLSHAVDIEGLLDLRWVEGDSTAAWLHEGLGKARFDEQHDGLRLGQAAVAVRGQLLDTVTGVVEANGYDDRDGFVDITEVYLNWRPIPSGAWRWRTRLGAFFPPISLENTDPGWTSPYALSSSAINTWVGEELRTVGAEVTLLRAGQFAGSMHDVEVRAAAFGWNDPAGTLLAWRGWAVGDRVTSLFERLPLAALPILSPGGTFAGQVQWEEPFHEIDHRYGHYVSAEYRYGERFTLRGLHYDNNGDPAAVHAGQWAWDTQFDSVGVRWAARSWEVMGQWLNGSTYMGYTPRASVDTDYTAWFALVNWHDGAQRFTVRFDEFDATDEDIARNDSNDESGRSWTLAYFYQITTGVELGAEWLLIDSDRAARVYDNGAPHRREQSLQLALRWLF